MKWNIKLHTKQQKKLKYFLQEAPGRLFRDLGGRLLIFSLNGQ